MLRLSIHVQMFIIEVNLFRIRVNDMFVLHVRVSERVECPGHAYSVVANSALIIDICRSCITVYEN